MYRDPNQPYIPERYPLMLYSTPELSITVHDEASEQVARAKGYTDFREIDPDRDGLDNLTHEALMDIVGALLRAEMLHAPSQDLIDSIRRMRQIADARAAEADSDLPEGPSFNDAFEALSTEDLRAHLTERDGAAPHHRLGRDKLLAMARAEPIAA